MPAGSSLQVWRDDPGSDPYYDPSGPSMKVLFVHFGEEWIAGSEIALLEMMSHFDRQDIRSFLWCNSEAMSKAARSLGVPVRRDYLTHYLDYSSPPFSLPAYIRMVRVALKALSQTGADLVHCNGAAPAQWMRLACWWKGVPMLVNVHSPYLRRSRYVLGLHLADQVVAVASAVAKVFVEDGMDPERVTVVHNGFDFDRLLTGEATELRAALAIPDGAVVGAIAGSLIRRKGHDLLFEAMKDLGGLSSPFHLLVIGHGPDEGTLRTSAAGLPIHFLGQRSDIGAVLRDCADFLVVPSRQEAFGRVIIEAAAAGLPAIGTRVDGIPEAIVDHVTGLLVSPESPLELAKAIKVFVEDEALRRRMGAAAASRAREQFSIGRCTGEMASVYRATVRLPQRSPLAKLEPAAIGALLGPYPGPSLAIGLDESARFSVPTFPTRLEGSLAMLSVLMATHNGADNGPLSGRWTAMSELDSPPGGWNLVIVNNASTDDTEARIQKWRDRLPLEYTVEPRLGKSVAMNTALGRADGDLIVMTDDDVLPERNWLTEWRRVADAYPQCAVFGGAIVPEFDGNRPSWPMSDVCYTVLYAQTPTYAEGEIEPVDVSGPNMAIRRSIYDSGWRFDEMFMVGSHGLMGEDSDFVRRLALHGYKVGFAPSAIVRHIIHPHQISLFWIQRRFFRHGRTMFMFDRVREGQSFGGRSPNFPRYRIRSALESTGRLVLSALRMDKAEMFRQMRAIAYDLGALRQAAELLNR